MSTDINILLDEPCTETNFESENLVEIIFNMHLKKIDRIKAMEMYYEQNKENSIELINRMIGMYQLSGVTSIKDFLQTICQNENIPTIMKLEIIKGLIDYEEFEEEIDDDDTIEEKENKKRVNLIIQEKNKILQEENSCLLDLICANLTEVPTPCRIEAVFLLMNYEDYKLQSIKYFIHIINDQNIDCEYRYNAILTLEKKSLTFMSGFLLELFHNKEFVDNLLSTFKHITLKEFPDFKPDNENDTYFELLLSRLSYDSIKDFFKQYLPEKDNYYENFLFKAQLNFCLEYFNMTYYKILSCQYLLQKFNLVESQKNIIQQELLKFAEDTGLDYDRRADAADVLLRLGTDSFKDHARNIIMILGSIESTGKTIFDNAQNVHIEEVEKSVLEILEFFSDLPLLKINDIAVINISFIKDQIQKILKDKKEKIKCEEEENFKKYENKINVSLKRIEMDRALYSKYNNTLENILLKVWTYLTQHEYKDEMIARLLEELEEMSGTCSTGFASRLINVISGFGEFNIKISWEDQIVSNFYGRLNAKARLLENKDNIFITEKYEDIVELWLNYPQNEDLKNTLMEKSIKNNAKNIKKYVIEEFLRENKEEKIKECYECFSFGVLGEMTISSSNSYQRKNFSLFLRTFIPEIKEEMYSEFNEYMDDTTFDLYMRKAIMKYENL
ncbi:MAG: hypothetical protein CBD97_02045 [Pelagibacteraceae bacterium TMED237]|nr:MAG: hypothetical protein CBD97_02045 [Pelagibacteraceae bacterium TMED237]|tara:strand:- start:1670 stop:3691 length:2022 start_codon:yes stop_codon:yes gene_type:complete